MTKEKNCAYCGDLFQPARTSSKYCNNPHYATCHCGETFIVKNLSRPAKTCSSSCASKMSHTEESKKKRIRNNIEKYGVEHHFQDERIKKAIIEKVEGTAGRFGTTASIKAIRDKYGVDNVSQLEAIKEKKKATTLKNYNVENPAQSEIIKKKIRETNMIKYGSPHPMQNRRIREKAFNTIRELYGVDYITQDPNIIERIRATSIERYGVDYPSKSSSSIIKTRDTNLERYGVESTFSYPLIKEKIAKTNLDRYEAENPFASEIIKERIKKTMIERYGVENASQHPPLTIKARKTFEKRVNSGTINGRVSKINRGIAKMIEETWGLETVLEKSIENYSIDLYVPEKELFIEINPIITHNSLTPFACVLNSCEKDCNKHKTVSRDYHYKKALFARDNNLKLIQVYEWDLGNLKSLLSPRLEEGYQKHSARKLSLQKVDSRTVNKFFNDNHLQGTVRGQDYCYGLFKDEELLAVASFGASRYNKSYDYEFLRYAVKKGHIIHGGANKLFKSFLEELIPSSVISYVDFDHSTGPSFLAGLGFKEEKPTGPVKKWYNPTSHKTLSSNSLYKVGADRLLGTNYGNRKESGLDNEEILIIEGFLPTYTSGSRVFIWEENSKNID